MFGPASYRTRRTTDNSVPSTRVDFLLRVRLRLSLNLVEGFPYQTERAKSVLRTVRPRSCFRSSNHTLLTAVTAQSFKPSRYRKAFAAAPLPPLTVDRGDNTKYYYCSTGICAFSLAESVRLTGCANNDKYRFAHYHLVSNHNYLDGRQSIFCESVSNKY